MREYEFHSCTSADDIASTRLRLARITSAGTFGHARKLPFLCLKFSLANGNEFSALEILWFYCWYGQLRKSILTFIFYCKSYANLYLMASAINVKVSNLVDVSPEFRDQKMNRCAKIRLHRLWMGNDFYNGPNSVSVIYALCIHITDMIFSNSRLCDMWFFFI